MPYKGIPVQEGHICWCLIMIVFSPHLMLSHMHAHTHAVSSISVSSMLVSLLHRVLVQLVMENSCPLPLLLRSPQLDTTLNMMQLNETPPQVGSVCSGLRKCPLMFFIFIGGLVGGLA